MNLNWGDQAFFRFAFRGEIPNTVIRNIAIMETITIDIPTNPTMLSFNISSIFSIYIPPIITHKYRLIL